MSKIVHITVDGFGVVPFLNKKAPILRRMPIQLENALELKKKGFKVNIFNEDGTIYTGEETPTEQTPVVEEQEKPVEPEVTPEPEQAPVEEPIMEEKPEEQVIPEGYSVYETEETSDETFYQDPEGKVCTLNPDGTVKEYYELLEEANSEEGEEKSSKKKKKRK